MKIQRIKRKAGDVYLIYLPKKLMDSMQWKAGAELEAEIVAASPSDFVSMKAERNLACKHLKLYDKSKYWP